jgi:hypothetical protein
MLCITDDFGNARGIVADLGIDSMNANIRYAIDGQVEGIADEVLSGTCDDSALRFFGLVV